MKTVWSLMGQYLYLDISRSVVRSSGWKTSMSSSRIRSGLDTGTSLEPACLPPSLCPILPKTQFRESFVTDKCGKRYLLAPSIWCTLLSLSLLLLSFAHTASISRGRAYPPRFSYDFTRLTEVACICGDKSDVNEVREQSATYSSARPRFSMMQPKIKFWRN